MQEEKVLGNRIRTFRKRAGLSQIDLEIAIEASPGSLSRIENGEVNPTKETLYKIADKLDLNNQERQYFYGSWFYPASIDEVTHAVNDTKEYFDKKGVLAYLLDDRFRLVALSKSFQKFLDVSDGIVKKARLRPLPTLMLSREFRMREKFSEDEFWRSFESMLNKYYAEINYMIDDQSYLEVLEDIGKDPEAVQIWNKIISQEPVKHHSLASKRAIFKIFNKNIELNYYREPLVNNRRFEIIEYIPNSKLLKFVNKIIS